MHDRGASKGLVANSVLIPRHMITINVAAAVDIIVSKVVGLFDLE